LQRGSSPRGDASPRETPALRETANLDAKPLVDPINQPPSKPQSRAPIQSDSSGDSCLLKLGTLHLHLDLPPLNRELFFSLIVLRGALVSCLLIGIVEELSAWTINCSMSPRMTRTCSAKTGHRRSRNQNSSQHVRDTPLLCCSLGAEPQVAEFAWGAHSEAGTNKAISGLPPARTCRPR
jgi:hypothetical protein